MWFTKYDAEVVSFELVQFNGNKKSAEMTEITCDQKKTSVQLFENHDPLSLVNSGQDNGDDTGGQAGSQGSLVLAEQVPGCTEGRAEMQNKLLIISPAFHVVHNTDWPKQQNSRATKNRNHKVNLTRHTKHNIFVLT